jgi:hypothetical protein
MTCIKNLDNVLVAKLKIISENKLLLDEIQVNFII